MKKIIVIIAVSAMAFKSNAQKGSWYIGGVGGYNMKTFKDTSSFKTTNSNWVFGPEIGTFLTDKIQLGLAATFGGGTVKNDKGKISNSTNISPTLYGRRFFKITDNFSTFAGLYLNYTLNNSTKYFTNLPSVKTVQSGFGARLGIGIAYALSPRFTAVGQYGLVGYQFVDNTVDGKANGSETDLDFGVNTVGAGKLIEGNGSGSVFNIGLYYTFFTKK